MTDKTQLTLKNFFIYNDALGQQEGKEEEKVLYYYPSRTHKDTIMKQVGLTEAIITFSESFNPSQPCEVLNTERTKQVFYQPEEHFWIVMTLNVPYKFSAEGREYLGCEVQDTVCQAVLRQSYAMAHLFMGPFTKLLDSENPDDKSLSVIKLKLEKFYNKYLHSLHLEHCDILDVFQGVQFLPLDKTTFLQVQCFVNHVEVAFSNIEFSIFLFNEHLVWSGLEPEELQVVFRYLVNSLLLSQAEKDHQNGITSQLSTIIPRGNFITGPTDLQKPFNGNSMNKIPHFHLKRSQQSTSVYQMVVYKFQNATLCLFYKSTTSLTTDSFRVLDDFLSPRLRKLSSEVADYLTRQSAVSCLNDSSSRFVYFNRMNLATKSSIHLDNRRSGNISVPVEVLRLLADINSDHWTSSQSGNPTAETIMKTVNDYWVVGKLSNAREFYVVTQHKNANIAEISDDVKKICDKQLKSIFFHV